MPATTERAKCACPCKRSFVRNVGGRGRPQRYADPPRCRFRAYRYRMKHKGSLSVQYYTPPEVFERGRVLAGVERFDLDPATCEASPIWPLVANHYTKEDDGLAQSWNGNLWINSPYGRVIAVWIDKAIAECKRDPNRAICMLVPAKSDTRWWSDALAAGFEAVTITGRIRFLEPDGAGGLRRGGSGKFASAFLIYRAKNRTVIPGVVEQTSPEDALTSVGAR